MAAAAVATLGLVAGGLAPTATGATTATTAARLAPTPQLNVTFTKAGHTVKGPRTFKAGRVAIHLTVRNKFHTAGVIKLARGYTLKEAEADLFAVFGPAPDLSKLMRFNRKTTFFGGPAGGRGTSIDSTILLPRAGTYLMYDFGGEHIARIATLKVTGPRVARPAPTVDGTVVAMTGSRFGGSKTLPHAGTLKFTNKADQPHFLSMGQVANGTTRAQALACIREEPSCDPSIFRSGSLDIEPLDPGKSQTVKYDLPRGTYVQMCFYPDHMTGAPHAAMGMVRIVKLK
jgi:hypothetical protein